MCDCAHVGAAHTGAEEDAHLSTRHSTMVCTMPYFGDAGLAPDCRYVIPQPSASALHYVAIRNHMAQGQPPVIEGQLMHM